MKLKNIDYKLLTALDSVIAEQSFEGAAAKLHITQSAVSQRIKQLEQWLAQPVVIRSTPIEATAAGQKLLSHYQQVKQLEADLLAELRPELTQKPTTIAIALNADTLASWFIPAISVLLKSHNVVLDIKVSNEALSHERLKKGEVFAAISSQNISFAGGKVVHIGQLDYILCASKEFIEKHFKNGVSREALLTAPAISFDHFDNMHTSYIKQHYNLNPNDYPRHQVRSSEAFVSMALNGVAYALLPATQANEFLATGQLVDIAPNKRIHQQLYWHSWTLERGVYKEVSEHILNFGRDLLSQLKC